MPCITTSDLNIHYELHGTGHPLVLIHGGFVDQRMWEPQIEVFAERYLVVTYDMRGHGLTGPSAVPRYTMRLFADDLHTLISRLGLERPAICGLSLGGMVAQAYAAAYSESLSKLIICDTAASSTLTLNDKLQTYLFGWSLPLTVRLLGACRYVDYAHWIGKLMRGEEWFGRDQVTREYVLDAMRKMDTAETAKVYSMLLRFRPVDHSRISVPTLILNGEHETAGVVVHHTEYLRRHIRDSRVGVIPDAGHTSNMENPGAFNRQVLTFLEESGQRCV